MHLNLSILSSFLFHVEHNLKRGDDRHGHGARSIYSKETNKNTRKPHLVFLQIPQSSNTPCVVAHSFDRCFWCSSLVW